MSALEDIPASAEVLGESMSKLVVWVADACRRDDVLPWPAVAVTLSVDVAQEDGSLGEITVTAETADHGATVTIAPHNRAAFAVDPGLFRLCPDVLPVAG